MAHRKKSKDDKNLVYIEKSSDEESALKVAFDVWEMHDKEFNLTITEISKILLCERQWVEKHIKDNVKHIFLNENYRRFLYQIGVQHLDKDSFLKDYYYFSRRDFKRWLEENTVTTRQTICIDLSDYIIDFKTYERIHKQYYEARKIEKNIFKLIALKLEYENGVFNLLNKEGKEYFNSVVNSTKREAEAVVLKNQEIPEEFTSIKQMKADLGKSLEIVYRTLYSSGSIKYTIDNSLVRYDNNETKPISNGVIPYMVTIPYSVYKK